MIPMQHQKHFMLAYSLLALLMPEALASTNKDSIDSIKSTTGAPANDANRLLSAKPKLDSHFDITDQSKPSLSKDIQTESSESEHSQAEEKQTKSSQSDVTQSGSSQSEPSISEDIQTESSESDVNQSDSSQSEPSLSEDIQTESSESDVNQSDSSQSEPSLSEDIQTESSGSEPSQSEDRKTKSSQSESSSSGPPVRLKRRFNCSHAPNTTDGSAGASGVVTLINTTDFAELRAAVAPRDVGSRSERNQSECAVLLYYLPYCPYSVAMAPHYNALARAFPDLRFFAVDADRVSPFYANYTASLAPYIRLFRDRDFIGMNTSLRTLEYLTRELANLTGHLPEPNVTVTDADLEGPVSGHLVESPDYWLALSCLYFALLVPYASVVKWPAAAARLRRRLAGWAARIRIPRREHAD